jgi:hypothetical protein
MNNKVKFLIAVAVVICLIVISWYFNKAEAGGYNITKNYVTNNYVENNYYNDSDEALSACALGVAAAQIQPSIFSKHHQWGIGAGNCSDHGSENAVAVGYHYVLRRSGKHAQLIGGTFARSTEEVNAIGIGYNNHFD